MFLWFQSLSVAQQVYAVIAIPAAMLFLLQTLIFLFGGALPADREPAKESERALWHAVYALLALLTVGGWSGMIFLEFGAPVLLTVVCSVVLGIGAFLLAVYFMVWLAKLQKTDDM